MATRCLYSVVRYVPDDLRDEAVNIGVLLEAEADSPHCLIAFGENASRAASIDPSLQRSDIEKIIAVYKSRLSEQAKSEPLSRLLQRYAGGRVQLTPARLTLTDCPGEELATLKKQFVVEDSAGREFGFTAARLRQDVKHVLEHELSDSSPNVIKFAQRGKPLVYRGKTEPHEFDLALVSPKRTDLIRCITFDVKGYEEKIDAAKVLAFDSQDVRANTRSSINVLSVLYPPTHYINGNVKAFHIAEEILASQGIDTLDFSNEQDRQKLVSLAKERVEESAALA